MSTSMALMELMEDITNALDNGKFTIGVFIDLKKSVRYCGPRYPTC